jgi:hypothetical protein
MTDTHLSQLIRLIAGDKAADDILGTLQIDRTFMLESAGAVSRGVFAMALNAVLFHDLLTRVPTAAAYVADRRRQRERIIFDHGALQCRPGWSPSSAFCNRSAITRPVPIRSTGCG